MKLLILLFSFLCLNTCYSQYSIKEPDKIANFCKIWGFLKYHHPSVAKGKYDWDEIFLRNIGVVTKLKNKDELNEFYYNWILSLKKLKNKSGKPLPSNVILSNYQNNWINDTTFFLSKVSQLLNQVKNNSGRKNHYVKRKFFGLASASYINEKLYKDSTYPSVEMRLLVLSRYWNIVNYFYPYKYLTDTKWPDVLPEFIPKFILSANTKEYNLTLLELFSKLNDSHTGFNYKLNGNYKLPPFNNRIIDDKIIVLDAFNDSICNKIDIQYGDVILNINGKPVKNYISYYAKYVSASNYASFYSQLTPQVIWSSFEYPITITCERNGNVLEREIPEYPINLMYKKFQVAKQKLSSEIQQPNYKILSGNIAYINLKKLSSKKGAKKILRNIKTTQAVILDIRNYPNSSIFRAVTNFFCDTKKPFIKFAKQSIKYPGVLVWSKSFHCGKKGGAKYNGKVAVLIDENTISFSEYFTMALKTIPGVILVGNHTAGADGSNNKILLPGNIMTSFSNEAVYYPNGDETQRRGISPDIKILPTIDGFRKRKDEILEKAIEILSNK